MRSCSSFLYTSVLSPLSSTSSFCTITNAVSSPSSKEGGIWKTISFLDLFFFKILASLCLPAILIRNNADIHTRLHLPVTCQQGVQTQRLGSLVQIPKRTNNIYANFTIHEVNIDIVYIPVILYKRRAWAMVLSWAVVHNYTKVFATLLSY